MFLMTGGVLGRWVGTMQVGSKASRLSWRPGCNGSRGGGSETKGRTAVRKFVLSIHLVVIESKHHITATLRQENQSCGAPEAESFAD